MISARRFRLKKSSRTAADFTGRHPAVVAIADQ